MRESPRNVTWFRGGKREVYIITKVRDSEVREEKFTSPPQSEVQRWEKRSLHHNQSQRFRGERREVYITTTVRGSEVRKEKFTSPPPSEIQR